MPKMFGRYRIERELGKGAMGIVYLAEDTQLSRKVALKIPQRSALEDPAALERFYREAKTSSQIRHSHICPVYDVGEIDGTHYLTMAYIPGKPISCFLGKGKLPSAKAVASLFRKLALALVEAHKQGVVHRDLKPSNVMLDDRNEPVIMDFGLARQFNADESSHITQSGAIVGTPAYMAPEQINGDGTSIGPRSDIYSLGVMLYQFLTGELPFDGSVMMVLAQILTAQPPRPSARRPDVDPALEAICLMMMAHDPGRRYATMNEVAAALSGYLKGTAEAPILSGNSNPRLASTGGNAGSSPVKKSLPGKSAAARSGWKSFFAWTLDIGGGLITLLILGIAAVWIGRLLTRTEPRATPLPGTVDVAANTASELNPASNNDTPAESDSGNEEDQTESISKTREHPVPGTQFVDSTESLNPKGVAPPSAADDSSTEPPDDSMEVPEEPREEMTDNTPVIPTVPTVTPKRPMNPPARGKGRGAVRKLAANSRGSAGKKPSMPNAPPAQKNVTAPPIAPPPEPSETEKTFAQYEAAVKKAHDELISRFDRSMKEIEKSTKLSQEQKTRILAELQVEQAMYVTKKFIPFSTRMRKYAEAYCVAMDKAEKTAWDRLKRYGASPEDIEAAQRRMVPRVLGVWQCEAAGERFELRLMSDLKLNSDVESRQGSWTFDQDALNLKFPDPKAPGGIWHYKCKMNFSGRGFTATHAKAPEIKGVIPK